MDRECMFDDKKTVEPVNSTANVTKRILKSDGNSLRISVVNLLVLLLGFAVLFVSAFPTVFFDVGGQAAPSFEATVVMMASLIALFLGFVFVFLPFVSGILNFVMLTVDGECPAFTDICWSFKGGKRYFASILVAIVIFLRIVIIVLPFVGGIMRLPAFCDDCADSSFIVNVAEGAFVACLTLAATAIGAYLSSYLYFVPYLVIAHEKGFFKAILMSVRLGRGRRTEIVKMSFGSIGYLVISALSFLVLWVIYVMPRMSATYFVYCNKVVRDEII